MATDDMSIAMSVVESSGTCYIPDAWSPQSRPMSDAAAVEVVRAGGDSVLLRPWYEPANNKAYAWAPRITGSVSFLLSTAILWIVLRDRRAKLAKTRYRLLMGMCLADLINSFAFAMSSAPIPAGTFGAYGAVGTTGTCSAQGFFIQLGLAEPAYSCMLSLYFVLVIEFRVGERRLRRRIEPIMHAISVMYPLGTAVAGLALRLFNSSGTLCWIEPYPHGCANTGGTRDWCECTRGINAFFYEMVLAGVPLFIMLFVIVVALSMIIVSVWRFNCRMRALNAGGPPSARDAHQIKATAMSTQAFLYIWAFGATYALPVTMAFTEEFGVRVPVQLHLVMYTLLPLQGFWNFVAFMQPRCMFARNLHPQFSRWKVFKLALLGDPQCRRLGRTGAISALNGEQFEPRRFQIGTASMRTGGSVQHSSVARATTESGRRQGEEEFEDDDDDSSFDYADESWPRGAQQSSALSSFYDSEYAVDLEFDDEPEMSQQELATCSNEVENNSVAEAKDDSTHTLRHSGDTAKCTDPGDGDMVDEPHDTATSSVLDGRGEDSAVTKSEGMHEIAGQSGDAPSSDSSDMFIENDGQQSSESRVPLPTKSKHQTAAKIPVEINRIYEPSDNCV